MYRGPAFRALLLTAAFSLSGCGITYVSPLVSKRANDGVTVVLMTRETVAVANLLPYEPQELPAIFSQTAGGGSPRGTAALPAAPVFPDLEPGALELRVPPPATPGPYHIGVGD